MERKYQIFISSTFIDLVKERQAITKQILDDHHFPIGMEMFAPTDKKQWDTIKATIDSSDIYFLIVGYRYGSIDTDEGVSFTEKEFNYAIKKGKPVIAFISNENIELQHENLKEIRPEDRINPLTKRDRLEEFYSTFYDKDQTRISAFRKRVKANRLTGFFNSSNPIDVKSAIHQKIKDLPSGGWVKQKYFLQSKFFVALILLLGIIGTTLLYRENLTIRNRLKSDERNLFSLAKDSSLEFARVIHDYPTLMTETNIGETFKTAKDSFYFISNAGKVFYDYDRTIDSCVKRGVCFKVILIDTASENPGGLNHMLVYDPDYSSYEKKINKMRGDFIVVVDLLSKINNEAKTKGYKGRIELKLYSGPAPYQMWLKDPNNVDGLAHFNTVDYTGFKPNFRITPTSSPKLFNLLKKEFNLKWNDSRLTRIVF